nr:hypothetical protein [Mucilaginibacter sp. E4BP6]
MNFIAPSYTKNIGFVFHLKSNQVVLRYYFKKYY